MRRRKLWLTVIFMFCFASTGCIDAVREGATGGVKNGIEAVIEGLLESALQNALSGR